MIVHIKGNPVPQKRHRHTRSGHTYDPSKKDKTPFITKLLLQKPEIPFSQPLMMRILVSIERPKSHYRTGKNKHKLKKGVQAYPRGDCDNYAKFVMDCCERANYFHNDSQVVALQVEKVYGEPFTEIYLGEV